MDYKSRILSTTIALALSGSLFAMDPLEASALKPVRVGDYLQTRQAAFGNHVAVVVKSPKGATLDPAYYDQIILAENSPGGVKLVKLRDFIINGLVHCEDVREEEKNQPYLIVARALSALCANIVYDIGLKNCGLFGAWCLIGATVFPEDLKVKDFRKTDCRSLSRDMNLLRHACNGTPEGKEFLIAEANKHDKVLANILSSKSVDDLATWGYANPKGQDNLAQFIKVLHDQAGIDLTTKSSKDLPGLASIVSEAFLLPENILELTASNIAKLTRMSDDQALSLCSQIVDSDVDGKIADVNQLLEQLSI